MLPRSIIAGFFLLTSVSGFADTTQLTGLTLQEVKAKCSDILANPQMVKPRVKITCNELSYHWAPAEPKNAKLQNFRNVGATVQMKGYQVGHQFFAQTVPESVIQCPQFVRIERRVNNVDFELSCEQLAEIEDLGTYCAPLVEQRAAQDPALVEERPTAEITSLCPVSAGD